MGIFIPDPGKPRIVLLLPMRTLVEPSITPWTMTTAGALLFSETAAVNWARVETVVTVPSKPPIVLLTDLSVLESTCSDL